MVPLIRDGSAVELVGLSYSVISWLADLHSNGSYPYAGVSATEDEDDDTMFTYAEWADKIKVENLHD